MHLNNGDREKITKTMKSKIGLEPLGMISSKRVSSKKWKKNEAKKPHLTFVYKYEHECKKKAASVPKEENTIRNRHTGTFYTLSDKE